ncbi:MAG: ribokinase [bacterium]|nr:ribokinase [bacterium]
MSIVVFGSINMDLVVRAPHLPLPGQTLTGQSFVTIPGGKGANQAVACARLGTAVRMVGRVGGDAFGAELRQGLHDHGVNIDAVAVDSNQPSGVALITVDAQAENTIIVVPGANGAIDERDLSRLDAVLVDAKVLLLQLEIPLTMVVAAAQQAKARGVIVILDPAPAQILPPDLYACVDLITPNETEAQALVGFPIANEAEAARASTVLQERGVGQVIIKMGSRGAYWQAADGQRTFVPAYRVQAVDTVAAGDAFNGGLASALAEGLSLPEAVQRGMATGALSTTRPGAQPSMPTREEVIALMSR